MPPPSSLKKNILANILGRGWAFALGIVTVPFYIRFLGIEAYGLIGIYAALQAILNSFLDLGFGVTINRELARAGEAPERAGETRDLVRTMEVIYWLIGLGLGVAVSLAAPLIATYWIRSEHIPVPLLTQVILLMGVVTFVQWPVTFYQAGLTGLQKLPLLNALNSILAAIRGGGAILILWLFSRTVLAFFLWQLAFSTIQVVVMAISLWRSLPAPMPAPRVRLRLLQGVWRFAAGMSGASFFSFFLHESDKIVLSRVLTLEAFGYYALASTLNGQLQLIAGTLLQPLMPRLFALVSGGRSEEVRSLFHQASQLMTVFVVPFGLVAALFSFELMEIWLQDSAVAAIAAPIASTLFAGTMLLNLSDVPSLLTIGHSWVRFTFYRNLVSALLIVPLLILLASRYGGWGAALAWFILNLGYLLTAPWIIRRRILPDEWGRWLVRDAVVPLTGILLIALLGRWAMPADLPHVQSLFAIGMITAFCIGLGALLAGEVRALTYGGLKQLARVVGGS